MHSQPSPVEYPTIQQNLLIWNDMLKADNAPKYRLWFFTKSWRVSLVFNLCSLTKGLVWQIGGVGNRGCWRGNNTNTKQEYCKDRFEDVESGTSQINGTINGEALQGNWKNTEWVYGIVYCLAAWTEKSP